jgi:EamA domain-containing membrane protein RarD
MLVSAHTWAAYTVVTRDLVRRRNPLAVTFGILLIAAVSISIVAVMSADLARLRALSPLGVAALLYLAIAGLAVGNWFWQVGVARLGATRAGMYLYLEPLATLALAVPLLGEPFGASPPSAAGSCWQGCTSVSAIGRRDYGGELNSLKILLNLTTGQSKHDTPAEWTDP